MFGYPAFRNPTKRVAHTFMQAMGIVNDHLEGCDVRGEVEAERERFPRPSGVRD